MLTEFHALEANLRQSFRVLAHGRPRAEVTELDGVSIASLGAAFQMFNAAFLNRPVLAREDLKGRLACALQLFAARGIPWSFWICEDWLGRSAKRALESECEKLGMRAAAEMPGMVADSLREPNGLKSRWPGLPRKAGGSGLDIRRAEDSRAMEDFRAIGSVCFHVPLAWFSEVFDDSTPSREFACWVGYREGQPVATAATVVSDGVIGLYNIATIPDERGRGYAETITRHAVAMASRESGMTRVALQSTAQGERLYKRLGFREVSRVVVFNSGLPV